MEINKKKQKSETGPLNRPAIKILLAEDSLANMYYMKALLQKLLPTAVLLEAKNGQEAIEIYLKTFPDILFLDLQMPLRSGYEVSEFIRNLNDKGEETTPVPIIALTADTELVEKEKCLKAGMNDCLSKPLLKAEIVKILKKWVDYAA